MPPGRAHHGYTLTELLLVIAIFVLVAAVGAEGYRRLRLHKAAADRIEGAVAELQTNLIRAHLAAQRGRPQEVRLDHPDLDFQDAPEKIRFEPPNGRLEPERPLRFTVGKDAIRYVVAIDTDGVTTCTRQ